MRFAGCVMVSAALLVGSVTVFAESGSGRETARQHFDQGVELFEAGDYEAALVAFSRAYEAAPHYLVLYNMGNTLARLGRVVEARRTLEQYLREGETEIPARRRADVERRLSELRQRIGELRITVAEPPRGAQVFLDGRAVGPAPLAEPVSVGRGRHVVEVRADNYQVGRQEVSLEGQEVIPLRFALAPLMATGFIMVNLALPGVTIYLDGDEVGTTPLQEPIAAPTGRHLVRATRPGYQEVRRRIEIAEGEAASLELALRPVSPLPPEIAGQVEVNLAGLRGAVVRFDGGPIPPEGRVPAGPHQLRVTNAGFEEWQEQIEVRAGTTTTVVPDLQPTPAYRQRYTARSRRIRRAAWSAGAVSVGLLGTCLGLFLWNNSRFNNWQEEHSALQAGYQLPPDGAARPADQVLLDRQAANDTLSDGVQRVDATNWALLAAGLAAAVAAAALFVGGPRPGRWSRQVSLLPTPRGVAARLTWGQP